MAKMTRDAVAARLREMADRSATESSPMPRGVDMSAEAVTARLRELADVSELCRRLRSGG